MPSTFVRLQDFKPLLQDFGLPSILEHKTEASLAL